jgi:hypothetical protein
MNLQSDIPSQIFEEHLAAFLRIQLELLPSATTSQEHLQRSAALRPEVNKV